MSGKHPEGHPQRYSLCLQIPRATLSASDPISSVAGPSLGNMRAESAYSLRVHHGGGPTLYSLGFLSLDLVCPLTKPVSFEQQYPEVDVTWFILAVEGRACQGAAVVSASQHSQHTWALSAWYALYSSLHRAPFCRLPRSYCEFACFAETWVACPHTAKDLCHLGYVQLSGHFMGIRAQSGSSLTVTALPSPQASHAASP